MKKTARLSLVIAMPLLLAGCFLPLPVQIANLVVNGISLMATHKTVSDHGVSLVAGKDCAMWRGLKGEPICRENTEDGAIMASAAATTAGGGASFASLPVETAALDPLPGAAAEKQEDYPVLTKPVQLASLDPILPAPPVPSSPAVSIASQALPPEPSGLALIPVFDPWAPEEPVLSVELLDPASEERPQPAARAVEAVVAAAPPPARGGYHLVVGSFFARWYADRLALRHADFDARVVTAPVRGKTAYRVVIGPFDPADRQDMVRKLAAAGLAETWAINLAPERSIETADAGKDLVQVAALPF